MIANDPRCHNKTAALPARRSNRTGKIEALEVESITTLCNTVPERTMRLIPHIASLSGPLGDCLRQDLKPEAVRPLINLYISSWDFDEDWYLAQYDDLRSAIPSPDFRNGRQHFVEVGYFEGRLPAAPHVDTDWYMSTYGDVAAAIIGGTFADARHHYAIAGYREGRLPCDPGVHPAWYAPRYMPFEQQAAADQRACTEHFITHGYRNGALPAPPR